MKYVVINKQVLVYVLITCIYEICVLLVMLL